MWRLGVQGSSGTSAWFRSALIHATAFSQVLKVTLLVSGPLRLAISGGEGEGHVLEVFLCTPIAQDGILVIFGKKLFP